MKKLLVTLLALFICFSLTGCKKEEEIVNPVKKYETLQEINEIAGVTLVSPAVPEISDQEYYIIDNKTAAYKFTVSGYEYYMRGCRDTSIDMSGVWVDGKTLFQDHLEDVFDFEEGDGYKVGRFILGGRQYIFGVHDKETMDKNVFLDLCSQISNQVIVEGTHDEVKALVGTYQDYVSQRASANVMLTDIDTLTIDIIWPNTAYEYDEWVMTNAKYELTKLKYSEVIHTYNIMYDDGSMDVIDQKDFEPGYFEIKDNKLLWTGSGNEFASMCEFEKVVTE